jgi:carbamoyl-phosphate synthase large subunit
MDKLLLSKRLTEIGLTAPFSCLPDEFQPDGGEYIAKLRHSAGSRLVRIITTREELAAIRSETESDIVIQKYIPSPDAEYTIGVFARPAEVRSIAFRRELKHGHSHFLELSLERSFQGIAETVAQAFEITGCFNIQLRQYNGKNYIFEINPRISGTAYFRHQLGFEDVRWWIASTNGDHVMKYVPMFSRAIGLRELNEKFILLEKREISV